MHIASLGTLASILVEEDFRVLRLAPLDVTADVSGLAQAVAEQRLNPLKAKPVNKKIHASARGRKQKFQAAKDGR